MQKNVSLIQVLVILLSNPTHPSKIGIANLSERVSAICNSNPPGAIKLSRANPIKHQYVCFLRLCAVHFWPASAKQIKFARTKHSFDDELNQHILTFLFIQFSICSVTARKTCGGVFILLSEQLVYLNGACLLHVAFCKRHANKV
jgi:hypothetical protein